MSEPRTVVITTPIINAVRVAGVTIKAVRVEQAVVNVPVEGPEGPQGPQGEDGELPEVIDGGNF